MDLREYLAWSCRLVESAMRELLPAEDVHPVQIHRAMHYSLYAGGKRLRPALCFAACEAVGGKAEEAVPAAAAIEMIHTYSLIHDDLPCMDDDDLRRGRPTCHKVFGEAVAILAGDALLTEAFRALGRWAAGAAPDPRLASSVIAEIAAAAGSLGMVGGQVLDLQAEDRPPDLKGLEEIHRLKTGAVFRASVISGAMVGRGSAAALAAMDAYARYFGLAFQIYDDVLDIVGDQAKLGKPVGSDLKNQKTTYPALLGVERAREMAFEAAHNAGKAVQEFGQNGKILAEIARLAVSREA